MAWANGLRYVNKTTSRNKGGRFASDGHSHEGSFIAGPRSARGAVRP